MTHPDAPVLLIVGACCIATALVLMVLGCIHQCCCRPPKKRLPDLDDVLLLGQVRRCPRPSCNEVLVRDYGCNHVTCPKCGLGFNWQDAAKVSASEFDVERAPTVVTKRRCSWC